MPETMNDVRIRCPKCASENVTPMSVEVNRPEPPLNVVVNKTTLLIDTEAVDSGHKVSVKIHCNACGAGAFWINTVMTDAEVWVKIAGDPDDDEQGPQPTPAPELATASRKRS